MKKKAILVTPFVRQIPCHPGIYFGYGTAMLQEKYDLDTLDLNLFAYHDNGILNDLCRYFDSQPLINQYASSYSNILINIDKCYDIPWENYEYVYITSPAWFPTVATEDVIKLATTIKKINPVCNIFYFSNSLGTYSNEKDLKNHSINITHLNNIFEPDDVNRPVEFDKLPVPVFTNREKYIFDLLPFRLKHGCPWRKCKFCSLSKGWCSGYLERSVKNVLHELEYLIEEYDPKMFICRDKAVNGDNLLEFCNEFKRFNKIWMALGRGNLSEKELEALNESGCRLIFFGLESGSDSVLETINKGINTREFSKFIKKMRESGICPAPSIFVGSPFETDYDFLKTVEFIVEHKDYIDIINIYPFITEPASDFLFENKKAHDQTSERMEIITETCRNNNITVCSDEKIAEYYLIKKVYPDINLNI